MNSPKGTSGPGLDQAGGAQLCKIVTCGLMLAGVLAIIAGLEYESRRAIGLFILVVDVPVMLALAVRLILPDQEESVD
ncbi:MAG: hypothetical protein ACI9VM_000583 [Candidatus Azotimanducaceae bacterium]|jgi:hypothetical protein